MAKADRLNCEMCGKNTATIHIAPNVGDASHICRNCARLKEWPALKSKKAISKKKKTNKKSVSKKATTKPKKSTNRPKPKARNKPRPGQNRSKKIGTDNTVKATNRMRKSEQLFDAASTLAKLKFAASKVDPNAMPGFPALDYKDTIQEIIASIPEAHCTQCGWTVAKFQKTGKLNCPMCYHDLSVLIKAVVLHYQGQDKHHGLKPDYVEVQQAELKKLRLEQEGLKERLEAHVAREEYEQAAEIKKKLDRIDKQVGELIPVIRKEK